MSDLKSDAHDSVVVPTESDLQSRLVLTPHARQADNDTDNGASFSLPKTEQGSGLHHENQDHAALDVNRSTSPAGSRDGCRATENEVRDLLHVVDNIPVRLWVACLAGILERFAWYGATAPLQNYLQNAPGGEVPGVLGLHEATASNIVNALTIASYLVPVPAAVIADTWLGRYKTMIYSAMYCEIIFPILFYPLAFRWLTSRSIEAIGATILFATSLPVAIHEGAALGGVITVSVLLAVGSGAFKTAVVPFIADQYDQVDFRLKIQKTGERVVASRELTVTYIYNVYYWGINVICFAADCTPLLERYVGFWLAYLIPCCVMWLALLPIIFGRNYFVRESPTSNIMTQVVSALRYGVRGGFNMDAAKADAQVQHGRQVPWTDSFIEDIKRSLLTCQVLLLFPIHWLCFNQTFNNFISQAGQMVTYGIPNDMMKIAGPISGIIVAPVIQKGLYPYLTKRRVSFGPIARITVGLIILTLSMIYATVLQKLIYQAGPCYDAPLACAAANDHTIPNQISVFLQVPVYFVGSLAEVFCLTTGTEYAYNQAPKSMKTLVQAIWLVMAGLGAILALAFTPLTKDPHLVTMYAIMTGLLGVSTILQWVLFRRLDKAKVKEDAE